MAKDNSTVAMEGQLELLDFNLDATRTVRQADALIEGKQDLKKTKSVKLVRAAIMQINESDSSILPYTVSIPDLSRLFKTQSSNLYRDIEMITDEIVHSAVQIKEIQNNKVKWVKIPWVAKCEYKQEEGVTIQLNQNLRPYLIEIKDRLSKYTFECVQEMETSNGIRLFELLIKETYLSYNSQGQKHITFYVDALRESLGYENRLTQFGHFMNRVIKPSIDDINENTPYYCDIEKYVKKGKMVVGITFVFSAKYEKNLLSASKKAEKTEEKPKRKPRKKAAEPSHEETVQQSLELEAEGAPEQKKRFRVTAE